MRFRALDLFCRAGGVSEGLLRAGFDVVGVDILDCATAYNRGPGNPERHEWPAVFHQADALLVLDEILKAQRGAVSSMLDHMGLGPIDFIWASPPCQAHSALRALQPGKKYPDLIPATRDRLVASGIPYAIENVPGAPLGGWLALLCGTMFGLQTPDGRAELRRHRLFETSFSIPLRPACQHGDRGAGASKRIICVGGGKAMAGGMMTPQGERRRLVLSVAGDHPDAKTGGMSPSGLSSARERFSTADAQAAMGIDWMAMKDLSQAIPPAYAEWIGRRAIDHLVARREVVA